MIFWNQALYYDADRINDASIFDMLEAIQEDL